MRIRTLLAVLGVSLLSLALPGIAHANTVAGNFVYGIGSSLSFPVTTTAQRDQVVILQSWKGDLARQMKAANPNLAVLAYEDLSSMVKGARVNGLTSSGVGYDQADTAHPDWFLLNKSGQRFAESGYSWLWMADVGNAGYQQQWATNVVNMLKDSPFDGVFADDTNTTMKYYVDPSTVQQYSTDASYQAATRSMLAAVSPKIHAAGKLMYANVGAWVEYPSAVKDWLPYLDGAMEEMFGKYSTGVGAGYRDPGQWKTQIGELTTTESMGKTFLSVTQAMNTDTQAQRFGWASTLLGAQGHTSYYANQNSQTEAWIPEYDADLGSPTSGNTAVGNGTYKRTFTKGLVLVNPTTSTLHVNFGGSYSGSGLTSATGADMPAHTGLVMTSDSATADPTPPAPDPTPPTPPAPDPTPTPTPDPPVLDPSPLPPAPPVQDPPPAPAPTAPAPAPAPAPQPTGGSHHGHTHHHHRYTSRTVKAKRRASHLVVKGHTAACARHARVSVAVDGHRVLSHRVRGGALRLRARVAVDRGKHRLRISVRGSGSGCSAPLTVDRARFTS